MKLLIFTALTLATFFASTFLILNSLEIVTVNDIKNVLHYISEVSPWSLSFIVVAFLFADLFIAIPTLTVSIIAGYFLGFAYGFFSVTAGLLIAGYSGYFISRKVGPRLLHRIAEKRKVDEMQQLFQRHGLFMLLICRATPILPEVTACLSGLSGMSLSIFTIGWSLNSLTYAAIATYAGSVSTIENPMPAIYTAIGVSGVSGLGWYFFIGRQRKSEEGLM
ncbi:MAG: VTT domain-containing protein [Deltaproteobacteria bacterium]|nr:VTT domain-containing protein [Deltaproteobacteria bacterium]